MKKETFRGAAGAWQATVLFLCSIAFVLVNVAVAQALVVAQAVKRVAASRPCVIVIRAFLGYRKPEALSQKKRSASMRGPPPSLAARKSIIAEITFFVTGIVIAVRGLSRGIRRGDTPRTPQMGWGDDPPPQTPPPEKHFLKKLITKNQSASIKTFHES